MPTNEEEIEELDDPEEELVSRLLVANVDISTIETALSTLMAHIPTRPLDYRIDEQGNIHQLAQPVLWMYEQFQADNLPLLCNGDDNSVIIWSVRTLPPTWVHPDSDAREFVLRTPHRPAFVNQALTFMQALGSSVPAFCGRTGSVSAGARIATEFVDQWASHRGECTIFPPAMPILINWVNYWSAETCRTLDFDIHGPKRHLFAKVLPCKGGGVALQLAEDSLDLHRPEHIAALKAAYDPFPAVHRKDRSRLH